MAAKFNIAVVTTSRADYGIYASLLKELEASAKIDLSLIVGGMHLAPQFGMTVEMIEKDGYNIAARVPCMGEGDDDIAIANSMGVAVSGFAKALNELRPELIVVLGDRYEMHASALAALPFRIPIAHIHGGEETEGAIDNALRHSMTKLSHVHFCSTELAASRIRAMGENPDYITVCGAPALDTILSTQTMTRGEWCKRFDVPEDEFVLLTYHPVTLSPGQTLQDFEQVWQAMNATGMNIVLTLSNADTSGQTLNARLRALAEEHAHVTLVENMGAHGYYSAMKHAKVMVGNSSSGIIEAASFGLAVINVGDRQKGREVSPNVIQTDTDSASILEGLRRAAAPEFQKECAKAENVYGDGQAAGRIKFGLIKFLDSGANVRKSFYMGGGDDGRA